MTPLLIEVGVGVEFVDGELCKLDCVSDFDVVVEGGLGVRNVVGWGS